MSKMIKMLLALLVFNFVYADVFLVYGGKTGWIGQQLIEYISRLGHTAIAATSRLEYREAIERELDYIQPDFVINAAGVTGRPNVDWCELHHQDTLRANVLGALNLADITFVKNIPLTMISTGCIFTYDENHSIYSGIGFNENEEPNFQGSFYSKTKIFLEKLILSYPHVLHLRLRMPIADDLTERAFIGKIIKYKKLINIPNSMAVMHDLLPILVDMTCNNVKGLFNFVNPGTISHHEILELYKQYIDPNHIYETCSDDEQRDLLSRRSNCELDTSKLTHLYPHIPHIRDSIHEVFKRMQILLKEGTL